MTPITATAVGVDQSDRLFVQLFFDSLICPTERPDKVLYILLTELMSRAEILKLFSRQARRFASAKR